MSLCLPKLSCGQTLDCLAETISLAWRQTYNAQIFHYIIYSISRTNDVKLYNMDMKISTKKTSSLGKLAIHKRIVITWIKQEVKDY